MSDRHPFSRATGFTPPAIKKQPVEYEQHGRTRRDDYAWLRAENWQEVLRDSDMQAATLGSELDPGDDCQNLRRGDLVFWKGHVAICTGDADGEAEIIHASGHTMSVAREPLREAIERISYLYEMPIGFRRP